MAIMLERKASKDEILELYLNEVYLGQRGSFAVHGVAEAARLFFGKDVSNLSLAEAATIAGVDPVARLLVALPSPGARARAAQRRAAGDGRRRLHFRGRRGSRVQPSRLWSSSARSTRRRPTSSTWSARRWREAVSEASRRRTGALDVYTTLDTHLQRLAQDVAARRARRAWTRCSPSASGSGRRRSR